MRGLGSRAVVCVAVVTCIVLTTGVLPASAQAPAVAFVPRVVSPGGTVIVHNADASGLCPPGPDDDVFLLVTSPSGQVVSSAAPVADAAGNWSAAVAAPSRFGSYRVDVNCGESFRYASSAFVVDDTAAAQVTGHAAMSPDGVREVDVDLDWSNYDTCSGGSSSPNTMGFPNGECQQSIPVQVTNAGADSDIFVEASPMIPEDSSSSWQPCAMAGDVPSGPTLCDGPTASDGDFAGQQLPGTDQFHQDIGTDDGSGTIRWAPVSALPGCDESFGIPQGGLSCSAYPGETTAQYLRVVGPSSTTDQSTTWSNVVTWVAMP